MRYLPVDVSEVESVLTEVGEPQIRPVNLNSRECVAICEALVALEVAPTEGSRANRWRGYPYGPGELDAIRQSVLDAFPQLSGVS